MSKPLPVILDVDTGADDALALILALRSPLLDIRAITCVAGNHHLDRVVTNTLKILDLLQAPDIPVAAGMRRPLLEHMRPPYLLHGRDGMADLDLPDPTRSPIDLHAVEMLHHTLLSSEEPVTLIALAPLTNIAVLLRMYPEVSDWISQILCMGGTFRTHGNTSPMAEFNFRHDPEAAAIVLQSGLSLCLYPLDPFRQISFTRAEIAEFVASPIPAARIAGRILKHMCDFLAADSALIGDAGAVATLIDPDGSTLETHPVTVELCGSATRGQAVFDFRSAASRSSQNVWWTTSPSEIDVVTSVDAERYRSLFASSVSNSGQ